MGTISQFRQAKKNKKKKVAKRKGVFQPDPIFQELIKASIENEIRQP